MKRKIALVIPSLHSGGMERVMSELANNFCQNTQLEVNLIMYGIKPELFYELKENVIIHEPNNKFRSKFRLFSTFERLFYLRQKIREISPDTVLSFGEYWNSFVLISLFNLNVPVFISDRCDPNKKLKGVHEILRRILYPKSKGIVVQTKKAKEIYALQYPNSRIEVVGNPVLKSSLDQTIKKENVILAVGRLIKSKQHSELIRIFSKINLPGWKLIIVGGNAQKQNEMELLEKQILYEGKESSIFLVGNVSNVYDYYKQAKIFAFASTSEGFPNVVGEALSAGLPVIAFNDVSGINDMVFSYVNGLLIDFENFEMFEEKLRSLMINENLIQKLSNKPEIVTNSFDVNVICQKYLDFILS